MSLRKGSMYMIPRVPPSRLASQARQILTQRRAFFVQIRSQQTPICGVALAECNQLPTRAIAAVVCPPRACPACYAEANIPWPAGWTTQYCAPHLAELQAALE